MNASAAPLGIAEASRPAATPEPEGVGSGPLWGAYLVLATVLVPFVHPIGPGQFAIGDAVNILAMLVFGVVVLARHPRISLPFLVPAFLITGASLVATMNALSPEQSLVTLGQDAYLYLWFLMLVNVCADREDLRAVRVTWMWMAVAIALYGVYELVHGYGYGLSNLLSPKGVRAQATFGNANFFADYLVISFFVIASLSREVSWLLRLPALAVVFFGLLASKSIGGMLSLAVGLAAWVVVRLATRGASRLSLFGLVFVLIGVAAFGLWVLKEWDIGQKGLQQVTSQSMFGRLEKSSEGRMRIWSELQRRFEQAPFGIGPGNSSFIELSIENRERRGSILGKEAHNDYVGYLVERGPIALLALIGAILMLFRRIATGWESVRGRAWRGGQAGAWAAALAAGLIASTVHSFTVEKLHFRHYWLFVALLWSLSGWMSRAEAPEPAPVRTGRAFAPRASGAS